MNVRDYKFKTLRYGVFPDGEPSNFLGFSDYDGFRVFSYTPGTNSLLEKFNWEWIQGWLKEHEIQYEILSYGSSYSYGYLLLMVDTDNPLEKLILVDDLMTEFNEYPIFDEDGYSDWLRDDWEKYWDDGGISDFLWEIGDLIAKYIPKDNISLNPDDMDDFLLRLYEEKGDPYDTDEGWNLNVKNFFHENKDYIISSLTEDKDWLDLYYAQLNPYQLNLA